MMSRNIALGSRNLNFNAWNSGETTKPESEVIAPIVFRRSALLHYDEVVGGRATAELEAHLELERTHSSLIQSSQKAKKQ